MTIAMKHMRFIARIVDTLILWMRLIPIRQQSSI